MAVPSTTNLFDSNNFAVRIKRAPAVSYFVVDAIIPSVQLPTVMVSNPLSPIYMPGDKMDFEQFSFNFRVDEKMESYLEIYNWMRNNGHPTNSNQYNREKLYSDITLFVLNSSHNAMLAVNFIKAHPVALSQIMLSSQTSDVNYVTCSTAFRYDYFEIENLTADLSLFKCAV